MIKKKKFYLTKNGLEKIKEEYKKFKELLRFKTQEETPTLLHSDDLSSTYLSFQEDLNLLKKRIFELENILKNAELIKIPPKEKQDVIGLGATILVEMDNEIDEFTLVGTIEADPSNKKISNESPIGKALINKKVGETIEIKTPIVKHICKILKISY